MCLDCAAGTYQTKTGQFLASACVDCVAGTWSHTHTHTHTNTHTHTTYRSNQTRATAAASCTACLPGKFSPQGGNAAADTCQPCLAGQYAEASGSTLCLNCVADTYSKGNASKCHACAPNSQAAEGSAECLCVAGFGSVAVAASDGSAPFDGSLCDACPAGLLLLRTCLSFDREIALIASSRRVYCMD